MLLLTRKKGQSIHIGADIEVTVLGVQRGQVRLGIEAPKETPVHRDEVYARIMNEHQDITKTGGMQDANRN